MIQSKYYSVKTHFGSCRGTECHFSRIKYCFCWRWWIFIRHIFPYIDVILWHFPPFSTHNVVIPLPYLLRIRDSGLTPPSVNLGLSNLLLSFPHLQRDATLVRLFDIYIIRREKLHYIPLIYPYTGFSAKGVSTGLRTSVKTSLNFRFKSLSVCPKRQF